ncbi:MAG: 16S rRNA (uracil(1498)-N(3))-methyltransferase [Alphaproteobacteria bacterium]
MTERAPLRLHVEADLVAGASLALEESQARYVRTVMRRESGDPILFFNGRDGEWRARLAIEGKGRVTAVLERQTRGQEVPVDLWLVPALLKRGPMELVVEKATELGVAEIHPVKTRRTVIDRLNAERMRAIAIEAAEQCGRLAVPRLAPAAALDAVLASWPHGRRLLICDESGVSPPIAATLAGLDDSAERAPWAVLVGPEGGFERSELDALKKLPFVTPVALGHHLLRAETAALAALACWQALVGAWARPRAGSAD